MKNGGTIYDKKSAHHNALLFSQQSSFVDPKIKEYEISEVINQREAYSNELKKAEVELGNLIQDLELYTIKSKNREMDLRNHIQNLSEKIRVRDINKVKPAMCELYKEILKNISEIQDRAHELIISKKKDIETRINLRIIDSEQRYKTKLSEKVSEKEENLRYLQEYTKEMDKIRDNYIKIKKKVEVLLKENQGYKMLINEMELNNSKKKIDLSNLKRLNNILRLKIDFKKSLKYSQVGSRRASYASRRTSQPESYNISMYENRVINSLVDEHDKNKINKSLTKEEKIQVDIEKIATALNDDNFLQKHPRSCGVISSLGNILENSSIRLNKLKKEIQDNKPNNNLMEHVYEVIKFTKLNTFGRTFNFYTDRNKSNIKNEIYLDKDQRKEFLDSLLRNKDIMDLVTDEKLPSITVIERRLNNIN